MARDKNWSYTSFDEAENITVIGNYIWDSNTLAWIKQTAAAAGGGGPVSIADGSDTAEGSVADAAWVSGNGTVISILKKIASSGASAGLTDTQLRATPVPVSGTVTATGPLTDTQLRASAVPVSGPLTDTQLRATPVPVSGTVTATGPLTDTQLRATPVPVSGTVNVGTVPVTGPLTDTQLRATPVPVSGTVNVGTVPVTGPLTDTQLRATPVPVSGTVTATGPLTDTQLRATPVPVSGTVTATGPLTDTQLRATAVPVSAAALPLPANAAIETGGNLAALLAAIGSAASTPAAFTLLDRLYQLGLKLDKANQETTQKQVAAALVKPVIKTYTTLLHR